MPRRCWQRLARWRRSWFGRVDLGWCRSRFEGRRRDNPHPELSSASPHSDRFVIRRVRTLDSSLACFLHLQSLGTRKQDTVSVGAVHVQPVGTLSELDGFLEQRGGLSRQHGLVDDASAAKEEEVAGDTRVGLGADWSVSLGGGMKQEVPTDRDEISGDEVRGDDLDPFAVSERVDIVRGNAHGSKLGQGADSLAVSDGGPLRLSSLDTHLEDDRALEDDEHKRGEERVVPVLVQAPEGDTEHLEDKERGDGVLCKELGELWDGNVTLVLAVGRAEHVERGEGGNGRFRLGGVGEDTLGLLERREWGTGVARVRDQGEGAFGCCYECRARDRKVGDVREKT